MKQDKSLAITLLDRNRLLRFAPGIILALFLIALPLFMGVALVGLFTKILIFALLVMSLDLLVGYSGLWSFGHAAFFGIAAYTTGILIVRYDITSFWLSAPAGVLMAVIAACIFGFIALRVSALYFLLITLALGQLVFGLVNTSIGKLGALTGGNDGLVGITYPDMGLSFSSTSYYYFVLVIFVICALLLYLLTRSPFGYGLRGIRESEIRMRCLGYNTWLYKYIAFIVASLFAGIAGVLYIHFNHFISPASVGIGNAGIIWLMLIIGGTGTLWGGIIGSGVLLVLQYYISVFTPERWPLIMGVCFIAVVMFFRGGIFTYLSNLWDRVRQL
jgi:branched-chain amino acid transport system permease protein